MSGSRAGEISSVFRKEFLWYLFIKTLKSPKLRRELRVSTRVGHARRARGGPHCRRPHSLPLWYGVCCVWIYQQRFAFFLLPSRGVSASNTETLIKQLYVIVSARAWGHNFPLFEAVFGPAFTQAVGLRSRRGSASSHGGPFIGRVPLWGAAWPWFWARVFSQLRRTLRRKKDVLVSLVFEGEKVDRPRIF